MYRNILDEGHGPRLLPAKTLLTIHAGAVLRHEPAGAGGWGAPLEHARAAYGVILTDDVAAVDLDATSQLRAVRLARD